MDKGARSITWQTFVLSTTLIAVTTVFSLYRLRESPPTWYDEGMILQLSENLAKHSTPGLQIAPGSFVSAGHVSTGFPVFAPIAASFHFFGVGILQGRTIAILYIALLIGVVVALLKRFSENRWALVGALCVATFSSLYGNGKNVLGEVPGLAFFILFLLCLSQLEEKSFISRKWALWSGLFLGLAVITKPIFILASGATLIGLITTHRLQWIKWRWISFFGIAAAIPFGIWLFSQFTRTDSIADIFSFYLNPYHLSDIGNVMLQNVRRFFTEATPLYTLILIFAWVLSIWIRIRQQVRISVTEASGLAFALLVIVFYLRTPGWYRYLFPADIMALIFFPIALTSIMEKLLAPIAPLRPYGKNVAAVLVGAFIFFQLHYTTFDSWVAGTLNFTRSSILSQSLGTLGQNKSVLVFNAPEVVPFLKTENYYQYFTGVWVAGKDNLELLQRGAFDYVIIHAENVASVQSYVEKYKTLDAMDDYVILGQTNNP